MIVLVGAGSIGKRHLRNLIACGQRRFVVVDPREDRRREALQIAREALEASPQPTEPLELTPLASLDEAWAQERPIRLVVIASPPVAHVDAIHRAVQVGAHVFTEKPLATDRESWERLGELVERVESVGLIGLVGYNYRFCPQLRQIRQMVSDGAVGPIRSLRLAFSQNLRDWHPWEGLNFFVASRAQGGGALLEDSHPVDLCRWIAGEVTEVMGYNGTVSSLQAAPEFDADDVAEVLLRFHSGAIGSVHMDLYGKYHQKSLEIIGEEATLRWSFDATDLESNRIELWKGRRIRMSPDYTRRLPEQIIESDWMTRNHMYLEEIRYLLDSIAHGAHQRDDVATLRDGLKTLAVLRAARRAAQSKRAEPVMAGEAVARQEPLRHAEAQP